MSNSIKPRRLRWWMPATIATLAACTLVAIRRSENIEANFRWFYSALTIAIAILVLLVWLVFFTGLRWRTRFAVLGTLILLVFGITNLVRYDGSADGTAFPRMVWNWTPRRDGNVGDFRVNAGSPELPGLEPAAPVDYPAFLGRERRGLVDGVELERDWNAHPPQQLWRQPIGLGYSAFAVSGSSAVTQEQRREKELIVCYALATGRALWAHTNLVRFRENMGGDGPRATPTLAGGRVYALGATGILDCLELSDGRLIWSRDILKENHTSNLPFGKASSPLVFDDLVVVTGGHTNGPSLLACRSKDGSLAWHSGTNEVGYSSPTLVTLGGKRQVLVLNVGRLTAHEPADGHILWEYHWKEASKALIASQPLVLDGERVVLSAGFGAGCVLLQIKSDGVDKFSVAEVWKNLNMKTHFSSVVARDGFAYGLDDGILACIDLATGKRQWKDGRYGRGQLLRVSDLLLVQTEPGPVVLVEANPSEQREVARLGALSSKTWNNPALAGDFLLVRNDQEAACYRLPVRSLRAEDALRAGSN